ncbi:beta-lactamase family protein [Marivirga sp. S37H4]|uniref:Beta-lactamase family protein n=1 Tax=Marivirga aurantiaca TaxID=2802615 RepID=A0A934WX06_9BACT|nr:serine hydrolase domain-containing protein [Marivirga aurantiaca]MBK6264663.1 beta-lactamase family protein [Marivirga aurantiaca]
MKLLLTLFICSLASAVSGQHLNTQKMDSLFTVIENENQGMGNIAILKEGELIYSLAYGMSEVESEKKANTETIYRIGSISKTFTATLIMLAVEENGLLKLDDKLSKYYPQFENSDNITIEHLLRHKSGLYNFTNSPDYPTYMTKELGKDELLAIMAEGGSSFPPGEKFEYSNTGYVLLSYILEDVYQKPYAAILKEKIILPLQLKRTAFGEEIETRNNEANSYRRSGRWEKLPETFMKIPMGAGAITSTATETSIFFHKLLKGDIVSEASLDNMKAMENNFGIGMFNMPFNEKMAIGHNGGIDGFQSVSAYFPEEQLSFTILSNGVKYPLNNVLIGALSIYFNVPYKIPEFQKEIVLLPEQIQPYTGIYSSKTFPLKITISLDGTQLTGQATGQPSFPLSAESANTFSFDPAGLKISFDAEKRTLELNQMGNSFILTKED